MTPKKWLGLIAIGVAALALGITWAHQQHVQADMDGGASAASLHISSSSFSDGGTMPPRLTCDGLNLSPELQLPSPPAGTQSFAIVMDDPDAPLGFTHWLAYNISPDTREIAEGASTPKKRFDHASEGVNSFGDVGYGGPCPPSSQPHHYVFRVYALDVNPGLPPGQSREQLAAAMHGHVLAEGQITGPYGR